MSDSNYAPSIEEAQVAGEMAKRALPVLKDVLAAKRPTLSKAGAELSDDHYVALAIAEMINRLVAEGHEDLALNVSTKIYNLC